AAMSITQLLDALNFDRQRVAVEVNRDIVARMEHERHQLSPGDQVEIVTLVGGGSGLEPPTDKRLTVGKFQFHSRLFTGTGKFATYDLMRDCMVASGCEVT